MRCTECGEPLVSILERSRKVCAACHVLGRSRTGQPPADRPDDTRGRECRDEPREPTAGDQAGAG